MLDDIREGGEPPVVIVAALAACGGESAQRSGPVTSIGRARGLEVIDADLRAGVHVPSRLAVERGDVALSALGDALEDSLPALCRYLVETAFRRPRRGQRELILVEARKLRRDQVDLALHMPEAVLRGDGELAGVVEAGIDEIALSVHLEVGDEGVPVRRRAEARGGVEVHPGESKSCGNQDRHRGASGAAA